MNFCISVLMNLSLLSYTIISSYKINLKSTNDLISSKIYYKKNINPYGRKYYEHLIAKKINRKKFPISKVYYEQQIRRLNSMNNTVKDEEILGLQKDDFYNFDNKEKYNNDHKSNNFPPQIIQGIKINMSQQQLLDAFGIQFNQQPNDDNEQDNNDDNMGFRRPRARTETLKSENFEVIKDYPIKFKDVGGYNNVKEELNQCIDLLKNYSKYEKFNVRVPKGLVLEGPPGTGKTLISKALAGEAKCSFIGLSGSDFQEKYVGVGATRIKELFKLAKKNIPCIIFIDEIDAVGRKRSTDGESSNNERDSTLNALLVELDGFKNNTGIFVVAATNRIDLLDSALVRPGRIDKKIFIGLPDAITRKSIIEIHISGKPHDKSVINNNLIENTEGLTGSQIENLLNEAMLNALRENRNTFTSKDFELVLNKMMVGWQPNEHEFTSDIIDHIAVHEMGHAILGMFSKHHAKVTKVVINFSSPKSPGYTVFESSTSNIYTRESLFEHLMILLGGRIAEELFYGVSVTTGAINDFEEALKLAEKMVVYYGMGTNVIYPNSSDKYKELIDNDVTELINNAYKHAEYILYKCKELVEETSVLLKNEKYIHVDKLKTIIDNNYSHLNELQFEYPENE